MTQILNESALQVLASLEDQLTELRELWGNQTKAVAIIHCHRFREAFGDTLSFFFEPLELEIVPSNILGNYDDAYLMNRDDYYRNLHRFGGLNA